MVPLTLPSGWISRYAFRSLAGRLVTGNRRREDYRTFIGLANSLGRRVLPMQFAILRITFAGIEKLFLAIDLHDGDIVIQLTQVKIIGQEKITIAVGHDPHVRFESCSASKADEEPGELIPITPFLFPDIRGRLNFDALCLVFCSGVLAGKAGIFELHDCGINLLQLLCGGICRADYLASYARKVCRRR